MDEKTIGILIGAFITVLIGVISLYFTRKNLRIQLQNQTENLRIQLEHQMNLEKMKLNHQVEQENLKLNYNKLEEVHFLLLTFAENIKLAFAELIITSDSEIPLKEYNQAFFKLITPLPEIISLIIIYAPELKEHALVLDSEVRDAIMQSKDVNFKTNTLFDAVTHKSNIAANRCFEIADRIAKRIDSHKFKQISS